MCRLKSVVFKELRQRLSKAGLFAQTMSAAQCGWLDAEWTRHHMTTSTSAAVISISGLHGSRQQATRMGSRVHHMLVVRPGRSVVSSIRTLPQHLLSHLRVFNIVKKRLVLGLKEENSAHPSSPPPFLSSVFQSLRPNSSGGFPVVNPSLTSLIQIQRLPLRSCSSTC